MTTVKIVDLRVAKIKSWRPYRPDDYAGVVKLLTPATHALFGPFNTKQMLEHSAHRLVVKNTEDQIIACMCLRNYPNIPALLPDVWTGVLSKHYQFGALSGENTQFVHMLVWDKRYDWDFLGHLLPSMFLSLYRLQFIVLVVMPTCAEAAKCTGHLQNRHFTKMLPKNAIGTNQQILYISVRQIVLPNFLLRRASAEDNDELVAIMNNTAPILSEIYGPYYIYELLNKSTSRQIVVGELDGEVVGMMCLNADVCLERIGAAYDINAYNKFRKSPMDEAIECRKYSDFRPFARPGTTSSSQSESSDTEYEQMISNHIHNITKPEQSFVSLSTIAHRRYSGPSDVFLIELQSMRKGTDERLAIDLLEASFDAFPDRSYCVLTVPTKCPYFPLLSAFVRVVTRGVSTNAKSMLYTVQRNALFSDIVVRLATPDDFPNIQRAVASITNGDVYFKAMKRAVDEQLGGGQRIDPFVMVAEGNVIGMCILKEQTELANLRHHYDIEKCMDMKCNSSVCDLQMMIVQPAFMARLPFLMSELFRKSDYTSMFYLQPELGCSDAIKANTILAEMIPIRPRRPMIYQQDKLRPEHLPPAHLLHYECKPVGLFYQNVNSCTKRKISINERIVIVGCSTTAMGFLRELIFHKHCDHTYFANITLISPNGLEYDTVADVSELAQSFFYDPTFTSSYLGKLAISTWVNAVHGFVSRIDRHKQLVFVDDKSFAYDRLYLFCGLQYWYPKHVQTPANPPANVFCVNNKSDVDELLRKIKSIILTEPTYTIVVYGRDLNSYSCIQALIETNVDPKQVTFLRPSLLETSSMFNDSYVDDVMEGIVEDSGIMIVDHCDIVDWKMDEDDVVSHVLIRSNVEQREIPVTILICFERRIIDCRTIKAITGASLSYNGRLVINNHFRTNDPYIYAAGPMTTYTPALFTKNLNHSYFSSQEIGTHVASELVDQLNPIHSNDKCASSPVVPGTVFQFRDCIVRNHHIPGGLHFLWIQAPGMPMCYDIGKFDKAYGLDLITGMQKNATTPNYCRIHLNIYSQVVAIVCLTSAPINVHKYIAIWGIHESSLNNLRLRFELQKITDLHEYFNNPWIYLIYHDRYRSELTKKNYQAIMKRHYPDRNIVEDVGHLLLQNGWRHISDELRLDIVENYMATMNERIILSNLNEFLNDHIDELPMFGKRNRITIIK